MTHRIGFKIIDLQIPKREFANGAIFYYENLVRAQLISYHSNDMDENDIKILNKMSLHEILAFGDWKMEKVQLPPERKKKQYLVTVTIPYNIKTYGKKEAKKEVTDIIEYDLGLDIEYDNIKIKTQQIQK